MNLKMITLAAALIVIVGGVMLVSKKSGLSKKENTFIVGTAAGYAPFVSVNAQGDYEGFDIDVARALAKQMDKELILKDLGSMTSLLTALDQGSIDAIIWGMSVTQDRLKKVAMVNYQGDITRAYSLIFWGAIPADIKTIVDMQGKTVCVEPASSQDVVLSKYPFIAKMPVEKIDDALLSIQYGKADAAFVEPAIAKKFKNKYPEIQIVEVSLAAEDQVQGIGIVLKRGNAERVNQVERAVETLKATGVIAQFEQKWGIES